MSPPARFWTALAAATLLPAVPAAPAAQSTREGANLVPVAVATPPLPTGIAPAGRRLYGDDSLLGELAQPLPVSGGGSAAVSNVPLVNGQEADAKLGLYLHLLPESVALNSVENPSPIRGEAGQTDSGATTTDLALASSQATPDSRPRDSCPPRLEFAGVDMRLAPHAERELHWHSANEWSLIMKGSVRLSPVTERGETFTDDIGAGGKSLTRGLAGLFQRASDVWFFPAGIPHSIQALDGGAEFFLVFDDGGFSADATFLISEVFLRNPKEVLSKYLKVPILAFDNLPRDQLYVFDGTPAPADIREQDQTGPAGTLTFITRAIGRSARITVFLASESSNTFDFTVGDVRYIPASNSHYIENTGTEDLIFPEVISCQDIASQRPHSQRRLGLKQPVFGDISVSQWLALTPKQIVKDHLHLPDSALDNLPKTQTYLKQGNRNMTALAGNPNGTAAYDPTN
ncbi:hypothetical protein B2J93_146 [Marssonina coronariae]|uniref:Cupin type-1 domain-containing protein n=1 Tax=Diplocarpon coronariae TaxID=2795749 RepID=A0A218Z3T9_9HELO|nr:hypothetical protein B2J93_146 [Marssonina coronariae]